MSDHYITFMTTTQGLRNRYHISSTVQQKKCHVTMVQKCTIKSLYIMYYSYIKSYIHIKMFQKYPDDLRVVLQSMAWFSYRVSSHS